MDTPGRSGGKLLVASAIVAVLSAASTVSLAAFTAHDLRYWVEDSREADRCTS